MESFTKHLSSALFNTNKLIWRGIVLYLLCVLLLIFFLAVSLIPLAIFPNDVFWLVWPIFSIPFCSWCFITFIIYYNDSNKIPPEEEEVVADFENGLQVVTAPEAPEPLTLKESAQQALWWTAYALFFLLLAGLVYGKLTIE